MARKELLSYWSKGVPDAARRRPGRVFYVFLYLLTFAVAGIAGTIEVLNLRAGGVLPNRHYRNGDPAQGVYTWRVFTPTERVWRWANLHTDFDDPSPRPLTSAETTKMHGDLARWAVEGQLRDFVGTFGILQYLLLPTLLFLASIELACAPRGQRKVIAATIPWIVAFGSAALLWYRAYFTSLGG